MGLFLVFSPAILYVGCGAESVGNGLEAPARVEVSSGERYGVPVDDTDAADPIGGDPAFSDENWIRVGGIPGEYAGLRAAVADSAGNLYVGGYFSAIDEREVHYIAKWDGNEWSALGSGTYAFAASGKPCLIPLCVPSEGTSSASLGSDIRATSSRRACRLLVSTTPAGFETFFSRCAEVFAHPEGPDMPKIVAIAAEHGIHFLEA